MQLKKFLREAKKEWGKRRALLVLTLFAVLLGVLEFGQPLDLTLRVIRNKARAHAVSGQVVVVGIDDKALALEGAWPWNRERIARMNDALFAAGANRVFLNLTLPEGEARGDAALGLSAKEHPGRVFSVAQIDVYGRAMRPMPALARHTRIVSNVRWVQAMWNGVETVPYAKRIGRDTYDTIDAVIAGVRGRPDQDFPIDYSLNVRTIPYLSAAQLLSPAAGGKSVLANQVAGKDVIIGLNSQSVGLTLSVPGYGWSSPSMVAALGAETLKQGRPVMLGWLPAVVAAFGAAAALLYGRRRTLARIIGPATVIAILCVPVVLESRQVYVDIVPGLFLSISALIRAAWLRFGARQKNAGTINPMSGLFTTNAIRHDDGVDPRLLIAARIRHFADVVSTLPPSGEHALVQQIVNRLQFGVCGGQLLHGDDGNFFWLAEEQELETVIEQFQALSVIFRTPIRMQDKSFDVDVSFGLDREVEGPVSHRMTSALAAAHFAEQDGICWKIHDPTAAKAKEWSLSLLGELDQALESGRVWVAYQPKYRLDSMRMIGAEALVRWTHETRGPISPQQFVEMAERHGRIDKLTAFVLDDALRTVTAILPQEPGFQVAVNISPSLMGTMDLYHMVTKALDRHGLPPQCLILEVTETAAIVEGKMTAELLARFERIGVGLSIDDYGTGLSTLEYLRKIPAKELKIDRRFTAELCSSPADQVVMKSTIQLAHALGMKAVAEGIETAEQLFVLRGMDCDVGQGYHLARPMEAASIITMVDTTKVVHSAYG